MTAPSRQGNAARVAGLALAGGLSRRFGSEKALAILEGAPLMSHVARSLESACGIVAVSTRPGSGAEVLAAALGLESLADDPAHPNGPLAGVAAGLAWASGRGCDRLVTLPCDTPRVGRSEIAALLDGIGAAPAAFAVTNDGPHPLCAVWRTTLAPPLAAVLADGRHPSVRAFLADSGAAEIRFTDGEAFRNANDPDALRALRRAPQ